MAFPSNPTNGQQANINGITYTYSTALTSWNVSTSVSNSFVSLSATGNINSGNVISAGTVSAIGNITGSYIIGDGSQLTGLPASYGNANVAANLAAFANNPVSTTGNITAGYFIGDGSQLTGLPASYGNANVVANLAALASNPITTTGNISGGYILGNGSQLTGISTGISGNLTGNLNGNTFGANAFSFVSATGNITGGNLTTAGTMTAATVTETSSIALKENFRPIEDPLEKVLQLLGVIYDRKDGSSTNEVGLVAEDVEKVIPELVKNNSVAYTRLTVYLLESIKVLKEEIDQLKGKK